MVAKTSRQPHSDNVQNQALFSVHRIGVREASLSGGLVGRTLSFSSVKANRRPNVGRCLLVQNSPCCVILAPKQTMPFI